MHRFAPETRRRERLLSGEAYLDELSLGDAALERVFVEDVLVDLRL